MVGATAFAWHGDVELNAKNEFKSRPQDFLLTTPESLELLLTSPSHDAQALFSGLRAVVIDEVHAFVGTTRGAQLASLLERLFQIADTDFQRIGLSATVGNPEGVLDWLRGGSLRESEIVSAVSRMKGDDVSVRTYASDAEALEVISEATSKQRALIFTRSRRRAEEVGHMLGIPVHHSSVSAADRDFAVASLRSGESRSIVSTASLEMGIDIGDLDLVVHDGAPSSPASYLQRLGRAGRRTGQRQVIFTIGEPDDLLLILGTLARVRRGELGILHPQEGARLVLGQQALALTMQSFIADREQLFETLRWSPTFAGLESEIESTLDHLVANRWLQGDGDRLVLGPEGHRRFGGPRGVADLLATFQSQAGIAVVDEGGRKIGTVDLRQFEEGGKGGVPQSIVLSGRAWTILRIDRGEGVITVRPGQGGKPPSWRGPTVEVDRLTWEAVREVLCSTDVPIDLDRRGVEWLDIERLRWSTRLESPARFVDGTTVVDSFCGMQVHRAALAALDVNGHVEGTTCELKSSLPVLAERCRTLLDHFEATLDAEAVRTAPQLAIRYPELLPANVILAESRRFHVDSVGLHKFLTLVAAA
jgi:ATP-dependent Lhr-like helicase